MNDVLIKPLIKLFFDVWYLWAAILLVCSLKFFTPILKGFFGELAVRTTLRALSAKDYTFIHDIIVSVNDRLTQIDHVVVAKTGIFIIETKDYKGLITGSETAAKWTQHLNKRKIPFHSPIQQNYRHIMALSVVLQLPVSHFYSLIAFSPDAKVKVDSKTPVLRYSQLADAIRSHTTEVLSAVEKSRIARQIQAIRQQNKGLRKAQIRQARKRAAEQNSING